jgi:hypothetical protein
MQNQVIQHAPSARTSAAGRSLANTACETSALPSACFPPKSCATGAKSRREKKRKGQRIRKKKTRVASHREFHWVNLKGRIFPLCLLACCLFAAQEDVCFIPIKELRSGYLPCSRTMKQQTRYMAASSLQYLVCCGWRST